MLSKLATALLEQHALIGLQIARAKGATAHDVVPRCRHVMRSVYAHLSAVKKLVLPAFGSRAETERVQVAVESVATALAAMAAVDGLGSLDGLGDVMSSLNALIAAERDLLASAASVSHGLLGPVAFDVEEHFEALYGRDQAPQVVWGPTHQ